MGIEVLSINVGKPISVAYHDKEVSTGIYKKPIVEPVFLSTFNFEGDGQGDLVHHGGKEKAVCVYAYEHYPFWEKELKQTLDYGAFGENLTIRGLVETDVHIGDVFKLGEAIVQVSQPRQPCYKLSMKYNDIGMPLKVQKTGFSGFYFRVLQEGVVAPVDDLIRTQVHPKAITVAFANRCMHQAKDDYAAIESILQVDALSSNWRRTFLARLEGKETHTRERLTGEKEA